MKYNVDKQSELVICSLTSTQQFFSWYHGENKL